eukprot:COSAG06_NODE_3735_length_4963_cov_10.556538_2_plen_215_part_00
MFVSTHCFIILCDDGAGTAALTRGQQAFDSQQWVSNSTASHYSFSVESPDSLMADTLYAQLLADSVGIGSLIDEEKMKTHLETEALWNDSPYGLRVESNAGVSSGSGDAVWQVRKTALFEPFMYINALFYQDRLGTNIGKTQKRAVFCRAPALTGRRSTSAMGLWAWRRHSPSRKSRSASGAMGCTTSGTFVGSLRTVNRGSRATTVRRVALTN